MSLKQHSVFYYGHTIDENNNLINFTDFSGGPEITTEIPVGSYTFTRFVETIVAALNSASLNDWTFTVNRSTRLVELICSTACDVLFFSGSNAPNAPTFLLGFEAVDYLNQTNFVGSFPSGFEYLPQFPLQDYKPKEQNKKLINSVVTKSASGDSVSVQSFGVDRFIKGNIKWITNKPTDGVLRNNTQAVEDAEKFMDEAINKNPMEFMVDELSRNVFDKVYLESTPQSGDGTNYELKEYTDQDLPEYYETGLLTFKVINKE